MRCIVVFGGCVVWIVVMCDVFGLLIWFAFCLMCVVDLVWCVAFALRGV